MTFLVGSGAGFSGDRTDAPVAVVDELVRRGQPCALIFETLGERTLAAAHRAMADNPKAGYEPLLEEFLAPVIGSCVEHGIPILSNFGAANPAGACREVANLTHRQGARTPAIWSIQGDDVRQQLGAMDLEPWDAANEALPAPESIISANVYLGAERLVEALERGAEVVVTGRVADPALVLAPLVHHYGWRWDDWDRLARGAMAGHLLECGAQITGGYFADPGLKDVPDLADLGYPIVEVEEDGRIVVTKPPGTGGMVTVQTVKEQLLYEVHDPAHYITPDVIIDLSDVQVTQTGPDRVAVTGIRGKPAPQRLKATVCFDGGWQGEAEISYAGPNALARARLAASVLRERLRRRMPAELRSRLDFIGLASLFDDDAGTLQTQDTEIEPPEIRLRLAVEHGEQVWARRATQELLALYCAGPAGGGGVRQRFERRVRTASFLVPRAEVPTAVHAFQTGQNTPRETGVRA